MKLVAQVKLLASPEQKQVLLTTLKKANEACNRMSEHAWQNKCFKQFDLHKACYHNIREEFGLASQLIIRCNAKVADSYKLDKLTKRDFRPTGSIAYDSRILTFFTEESQISLWTVVGRMKIPFAAGEFQKEMLLTQKGECDLCFIGGEFYLMVVCDIAEAPQNEATEYIGVDLGIVQIASDSEGNQYSGESIRSLRRRMRKLKAGLQHTAKKHGSKSAKRHLQKLRRRQSRFTKWVNHNISRRLVESAAVSGKAIALEDLSGIRERASVMNRDGGSNLRGEMRFELGNWSFDQLKQFVSYKARRAGVPVVLVDPRNTSRTCSTCGYCDKHNRKSQCKFQCLECGLMMNADLNAALNIKARGNVTCPIDGEAGSPPSTVKAPCL
jgi:putative transposase